MSKYRKKLKILLYTLAIIIPIIAGLNWYITQRLEHKIASVLQNEIGVASGGFYTLTFSKLSVGLISGELSINDLVIKPNADILSDWQKRDSLPKEYANIEIKKIAFKGVNLKFRRNFKRLNFGLFEIQSPKINIVAPLASRKTQQREKDTHIENPYQIIEQYIDVLAVDRLNLQNANVSYIKEDSIMPSVYKLEGVNFRLDGFILDRNSAKNGKLLYSDNLSFSIDKPQHLLSNSDFDIFIKGIKMNTQDSIIQMNGFELKPQIEFWNKQDKKLSRTLGVKLNRLEFEGIAFNRKDSYKSLTSKLFLLSEPIIELKQTKDEAKISTHKYTQTQDTVKQALSLYKIVSPVIDKIAIDSIKLNNAMFDYTYTSSEGENKYTFDKLNFGAIGFYLDSSFISNFESLHCKHFNIEAEKLKGSLATMNHEIKVDYFSFNSSDLSLRLKDISIEPMNSILQNFSLSGKINSISIDQINYNPDKEQISSNILRIDQPDIKFIHQQSKLKPTKGGGDKSPLGFEQIILNSFVINNGNFSYLTSNRKNADNFSVRNLTTTITGLKLVDELKFEHVLFSISHLTAKHGDSEYNMLIRNIELDSRKGFIKTDSISIASKNNRFNASKLRANHHFTFDLSKPLTFESLIVNNLKWKNNAMQVATSAIVVQNAQWENKNIKLDELTIDKPLVLLQNNAINVNSNLNKVSLKNFFWSNDTLSLGELNIYRPSISVHQRDNTKQQASNGKTITESYNQLASIFSFAKISKFNISKADIKYSSEKNGETLSHELKNTDFQVLNAWVNPLKKTYDIDNIKLSSTDIQYPIDDGFYTFILDSISMDAKRGNISLHNIHMKPKYPKWIFAYKQPQHKDWFDVGLKSVEIKDMDIPLLLQKNRLHIKDIEVNDVWLHNFKNQHIEIEHNVMPMIYELLYKIKIPYRIDRTNVKNFEVIYEELAAKNDSVPGKIFFTNMNGELLNITNQPDSAKQYIPLRANGLFMGKGYFEAQWDIPASPLNDNFKLKGQLHNFELTELNQLIMPMAPASIESGLVNYLDFDISAGSDSAEIKMLMLYNNLKVGVWKQKDGEVEHMGLFSRVANTILKHNNPDKINKAPRIAHNQIKRDPYHSTFNYFWQILQPATVESVGISQTKQNRLQRIANFANKVKNFFNPLKKKKNNKDKSDNKEN